MNIVKLSKALPGNIFSVLIRLPENATLESHQSTLKELSILSEAIRESTYATKYIILDMTKTLAMNDQWILAYPKLINGMGSKNVVGLGIWISDKIKKEFRTEINKLRSILKEKKYHSVKITVKKKHKPEKLWRVFISIMGLAMVIWGQYQELSDVKFWGAEFKSNVTQMLGVLAAILPWVLQPLINRFLKSKELKNEN